VLVVRCGPADLSCSICTSRWVWKVCCVFSCSCQLCFISLSSFTNIR